MNRGFAVSVWAGGVLPHIEECDRFVVTARHPAFTNSNEESAASDFHVVFLADRIFRSSQRLSPAQSTNDCVGCTSSRQTLVVFGDSGSCAAGSGDAWEDLFASLLHIEGSGASRASSEVEEAFRLWKEKQQQQHQPTGGCSATAGAASHGLAAGLVNELSGTSETDLLKALGPCRGAYAKRVCEVLSRRCRWRRRFARQSCAQTPHCNCMPAAALTSPSSAFSLVFHSESFGLLFFCRDKLGLASLLAAGLSNSNNCADGRCPSFVLATCAEYLRRIDPPSDRERTAREQAIEVPVDGVFLLDLWALTAPVQGGSTDAPVALQSPVAAFVPSEDTGESEHCSVSLIRMPSVYCIPWKQPSIIRTTHLWCRCAICEEAREHFWKLSNCQCCLQTNMHECPLPEETLHPFKKVLGGKMGFASAPPVPTALENSGLVGAQQGGGSSHLSSAEILNNLYRELWGAVSRAIPEALQNITGIPGPSVSGAARGTTFVGLLFSGGVDSTLLAGMVLRVLAAAMAKTRQETSIKRAHHAALPQQVVVVELVSASFSAEAPDRLTALRSFQDLLDLLHSLGEHYEPQRCKADAEVTPPSKSVTVIGNWALELRLVAVDVACTDSADCRSQLLEAIYPKRSHMDFNIAAPLYFSSRGIGYLVSPNFGESDEWQLLLNEASVWKELLIRPLFRSPRGHFQPGKRTHRAFTEGTAVTGQAVEPEKPPAGSALGQQHEAKVCCRVCRRQAKGGCAHSACKLCCAKLQTAAVQRVSPSDPHAEGCDEIHVGGQGRLRISDLGITVHTVCPVHRKPRLLHPKEDAGEEGGRHACAERPPLRGDATTPFKSLSLLPCGVPLATNDDGRPFMAMQLADLYQWCSFDERRWSCVDRVTGTYTVQSTVFLMGSGADEIFGGYGRHRTANLTKGWEALRQEQILDLRRLWFRNLGRDCRALSVFGRWARVPFLDERLLDFVCCSVPFEHIVQPSADVREAAEEAMRHLLMYATTPKRIASKEVFNCVSARGKQTHLLVPAEEPTIPADLCAAVRHNSNVESAAGCSDLCSGNKWLIRICAAFCGLSFSAAAKKRAMQFGSRSAKVSNSEHFPSNRKARGDATLESCDEIPYS